MTFVSYAQNFEDVLLRRAFRDVRQGFYIDVGAAHPDVDSVTRAFYDLGWRGINIEPVAELHARLRAARPRDVNLRVIAGAASGEATIHVIAGTGLSTVDADLAAAHRAAELDVRGETVSVATIAQIWREHAPEEVHFLKVDVEGAEAAVLEGAELASLRPQIVLVEATAPGGAQQSHAAWEPALLKHGYRFLWFDGLNRFYAAEERYAAIEPHFRVPVCVFDDFLRAADTEWTRRITEAQMRVAEARVQAGDLLEQAMTAEAAAAAAAARSRDADARAHAAEQRRLAADQRALAADQRAAAADQRGLNAEARIGVEAQRVLAAQNELKALHDSTSWRLTAPLRGAMEASRAFARGRRTQRAPDANGGAPAAGGAGARRPGQEPRAVAHAATAPLAGRAPLRPPLRAVHQFHSGSAVGDAITNAMLLIRSRLRDMGYRSDIYVEHRDPGLASELLEIADLPRHDGYVLILHLSMGFDAYDEILSLAAPKVLVYHNITPPEMFADQPFLQRYARLGREQLAGLRGRVVAALADSAYNALELRSLGFDDPLACALLFDVDGFRRPHDGVRARDASHPFTILFVGRVIPSKAQLELVEAFARFRALDPRPSRLVLVGRVDDSGQGYADVIRDRAAALGVGADVTLAGLVSEEALAGWYAAADLYLSLSRHEGFGVPLVEAAAAGVPVLAWPAGAVAFTVGVEAGLLAARDPDGVAARVALLAADPQARRSLARAQHAAMRRFALPAQLPILVRALARAGAAPPSDPDARAVLSHGMRFTVAGHVNKTYSLAAINRTLARTLDDARPGRVRLLAVEGRPTDRLDEVPAEERERIEHLATQPRHESGPVVVISQHYPVYVPDDAGDLLLAYVFWEESRLPPDVVATLNASFRGVLAPSAFVAKALLDSGVSAPVRVVGFAPDPLPSGPRRPDGARAAFTFLHVSSGFPRKGVDVLLAAYARAFRARDPVRLVVKTFPNPHNDAAAQVDALRRADPEAPPIELVDRDLDAADMARLMADADAMVLPTRGEGFNLPAAEALASGLKLIVTGYGGHMDFCGAGAARLVAFRLAPSGSHLATPASLWAEPDADDLALAMTEAVRDRAAAGDRGRESAHGEGAAIASLLSPAAFVDRIEAAAADILLRPAPGRFRLCVVSSWGVRCGVAEYARALVDGMLAADPELDLTVLADSRFDGPDGGEGPAAGAVRARAAWTLGAPENVGRLRAAVAGTDPDAVLIQHQPGLLGWGMLGALLSALRSPHRVLAVTLHNTAHLLDVDAAERAVALSGLRLACRVVVHTLADVERLRSLGLDANVVLIPQGAPAPLEPRPDRALQRQDPVTIASCGFLLPGKGLPALAAAAGLLKPRWPRIRLRLVCADYGTETSRAEAAAIRAAAREAGLDGALELTTDFLPYDEARRRLSGCDVVALPYPVSKEGSSAALRMALGSGACVAVTPIPLFDEAEDAVHRLPGAAPAEIADGLAALLGDPARREAVRRAARRWVMGRRWDETAARTLGMMKGLAASRPGP